MLLNAPYLYLASFLLLYGSECVTAALLDCALSTIGLGWTGVVYLHSGTHALDFVLVVY
jgi:hypothetical protein